MSIEDKNKGSKGVEIEGKIINANEKAVGETVPIEASNEDNKRKNIELKTVESEKAKNEKIKDIKSEIEAISGRNKENKEGNKDNKKEGDKNKNEFRAFEIKKDAVSVEMGDFLDDKDSDVITMISIDSDGKTYGDDSLDYEQLGLKLTEAKDALDRLKKKKEKLPLTNKLLETIRRAFSNEYTIDSEISKMMIAKATQGIGRLEKRVDYLEGRISKELL